MTKFILLLLFMLSSSAFAGVHESCHTENHDARVFAVAYVGAIIDLKSDETADGKKVYAYRFAGGVPKVLMSAKLSSGFVTGISFAFNFTETLRPYPVDAAPYNLFVDECLMIFH